MATARISQCLPRHETFRTQPVAQCDSPGMDSDHCQHAAVISKDAPFSVSTTAVRPGKQSDTISHSKAHVICDAVLIDGLDHGGILTDFPHLAAALANGARKIPRIFIGRRTDRQRETRPRPTRLIAFQPEIRDTGYDCLTVSRCHQKCLILPFPLQGFPCIAVAQHESRGPLAFTLLADTREQFRQGVSAKSTPKEIDDWSGLHRLTLQRISDHHQAEPRFIADTQQIQKLGRTEQAKLVKNEHAGSIQGDPAFLDVF